MIKNGRRLFSGLVFFGLAFFLGVDAVLPLKFAPTSFFSAGRYPVALGGAATWTWPQAGNARPNQLSNKARSKSLAIARLRATPAS